MGVAAGAASGGLTGNEGGFAPGAVPHYGHGGHPERQHRLDDGADRFAVGRDGIEAHVTSSRCPIPPRRAAGMPFGEARRVGTMLGPSAVCTHVSR
jgi:hypothetical protein